MAARKRILTPDEERIARLLAADPTAVKVMGPRDSYLAVAPLLLGHEVEHFVVATLDRRLKVIEVGDLFVGNDGNVIACPRTILRWALTRARPCHGIIVAHNHPSGDVRPSLADEDITRRINTACRAVGIGLLDHIIVAGVDVYHSFAQTGSLPHYQPSEVPYVG